ncbi:hypothetical protein V1279_007466 [Bradyrhizobium sp. AZCC 1610]|uniref:hypothetical protein n=1 Tax=Bradyrhizobium sp. AZCC 1610 TaxID=3117020 RepID=UPI002FEFDEB4
MFEKLFKRRGVGPVPGAIANLQADVVRAVASDVTSLHDGEWGDREWKRIGVNLELLIEHGKRMSVQAIAIAHRPGGPLEDLSFRLSPATKQKFIDLAKAMGQEGKDRWAVCDLKIERDGRYDFRFSYDPPPRLNGNLLHSPLDTMLAQCVAECGKNEGQSK